MNDILREQCGFKGVVFSDALDMGALNNYGSMTERADKALAAGCDMILICNDREATKEVLEHRGTTINPASLQRLETFRNISQRG